MCHHPNRELVRRPAEDFSLAKLRTNLRCRAVGSTNVENHNVRHHFCWIERDSLYLSQPLGQELRVFVVAMQIFRRLFQRNYSCRGEHSHLTHPSAEHLAHDMRLLDELV